MNQKARDAYMDAPHIEDEFCPHCNRTVRQVPRKTPLEAALAVATEAEAKRWFERLELLPVVCDQDGSGTDTGDSLDVIAAEIKIAVEKLQDMLGEFIADSRVTMAIAKDCKGVGCGCLYCRAKDLL
jgi:uncharacterized protein (DUF885 family)